VRFVRELKDAAGSKVAGMCCDIFCSNCPYTAGYAACWTKYGTLINITATFHIILIGVGTIYILRGRRPFPSPPLLLPPLPFSPFPPILPFPFPHAVQPFPPMSLFPSPHSSLPNIAGETAHLAPAVPTLTKNVL